MRGACIVYRDAEERRKGGNILQHQPRSHQYINLNARQRVAAAHQHGADASQPQLLALAPSLEPAHRRQQRVLYLGKLIIHGATTSPCAAAMARWSATKATATATKLAIRRCGWAAKRRWRWAAKAARRRLELVVHLHGDGRLSLATHVSAPTSVCAWLSRPGASRHHAVR